MNAVLSDIRGQRIKWLRSDLEYELSQTIQEIALETIDGFDDFKSMAHFMKASLDEKLNFGWNVIIGENISGKFKNRRGNFAYFRIGVTYFLVFNAYRMK